MHRLLLGLGLWLSAALPAAALDACPAYLKIHQRDIDPRIRSGIPFKLLSVAVNEQGIFRRIVRLEYDLWDETVTIETLGHGTEVAKLAGVGARVCKALSFPEAPAGKRYEYKLFLNPVLGEGLARLAGAAQESHSGLLQIDWVRLTKDMETEKVLLQTELGP
jgi:hypothetical protein